MAESGLNLFRMDGRVAIVTGGSRGLGRSIAEGLCSAGAIAVLCSRTRYNVELAAEEMRSAGHQVHGFECDVRNEAMVDEFVRSVTSRFGRIDILVNNAGVNVRGPIGDLSVADFEHVMRTNVTGPWLMCRAVSPVMLAARHGRVLNIASTLAAVGAPIRTPYGASKGALAQLTRMLAVEWAPHGVTVNTICPGPFRTEMNREIAESEDVRRHILGPVALGRWGELHEIQGAALLLASDASSYITGTTLFVDGGWNAS